MAGGAGPEAPRLAAAYTTLAEPLGLDPVQTDQARLTAAIRNALPEQGLGLLIFDNAEDPLLPRGYLPRSGAHALITSRRADWRGIAKTLSLDLMPEAEALRLLAGRPDPETLPPEELDEVKTLARAYMQETGKDLAGYRRLLQASRPRVLDKGQASPDYPASVARTWQVSIDAATGAHPAAGSLLELLAFFAPDALPLAVLGSDPEVLPEELRDEFDRDEAVAALNRFSLIQTETGSVTVHRLAQAVTRDGLDEATAKARAELAVRLVNAALPQLSQEHTNWPAIGILLPHALAATEAAERLGVGLETAAEVMNATAIYHWARAAYAEAEPLLKRAIAIGEKALGPEHPDLASWFNNLATLYRATGRHAEAEPLHRRALMIREKALPRGHPDIAQSLNNLAALYQATGRHAEAEPLFKRAIAINEKVLPPDHPTLATVRGNYASLLDELGRADEAAAVRARAEAPR